jgi:hypothetical protein
MSIAPEGVAPTIAAAGPLGAPFARDSTHGPGDLGQPPAIRLAEVLRLQPGDRLIIHADGTVGLGPGGAHKLAAEAHDALRLGELGFDVPVLVTAPGLRIEVLRP